MWQLWYGDVWLGLVVRGWARRGMAVEERSGKVRFGWAGRVEVWQLWLGLFGRGSACLGTFGNGMAVKVGCGLVRRGIVW